MDLYADLALTHTATVDEVRHAYRRLAKLYHPDVSVLPDAQARFIRITEAYEILTDPVKRRRYDLTRHSPNPMRARPRQEARHERGFEHDRRTAQARAEKFGNMRYERFASEYFDTAAGYYAPKMLGCFGIIVVSILVLVLIGSVERALDLPPIMVIVAFFALIPAGAWASATLDERHNAWQRRRKARKG